MMTPPTRPVGDLPYRDRSPAAAKSRSRTSVLGAILIDRDAVVEVAELLRPRTSTARPTADLRRDPRPVRRREPIDIVTVAESLSGARSSRRSADGPTFPASATRPDRRPCRPVRADRRAQGGPARTDRRSWPDRRHRLRGPGRDPRRPSIARSPSSSRSARSASTRLLRPQVVARRRVRPLDYLRPTRQDLRRPNGFNDLDALTTASSERPDRPGRAPSVGKTASRSTSPSMPRSRNARPSASSASRWHGGSCSLMLSSVANRLAAAAPGVP